MCGDLVVKQAEEKKQLSAITSSIFSKNNCSMKLFIQIEVKIFLRKVSFSSVERSIEPQLYLKFVRATK